MTKAHVLILVENLPVPFDRRVWMESLALTEADYKVSVISPCPPADSGQPDKVIEGIHVYRYPMPKPTKGKASFLREYAYCYWQTRKRVARIWREDRFDVIIIDSTDPIGPGGVLFTQNFYRSCKACLASGGVLVTQNGVPFLQGEELTNTLKAFKALFADAACYLATVPTYVGGPMAFGWGTDNPGLRQIPTETLTARFEAAGIETAYYTPEIHHRAFALPGYIAALIT